MRSCRTILLLVAVGGLCASAFLAAQSPLGDLSATDASVKGAVLMSAGDTRVLSGSSITAGQGAASLHLARGGEVRVCPRSSLSITASQSGRELMLALGTGAIETHYLLTGSADSVLTPDFRILLAGPGDFHFAIASDAQGNTCVRALPSDTASVIVNELIGDGVYQVRPGEQVLFRGGTVKNPESATPPDCGCPPPVLRAQVPEVEPVTAAPPVDLRSSVTTPPPKVAANDVQITVDAPFVFRAEEPPIPPMPAVAHLRLEKTPSLPFLIPTVQPPPPALEAKPQPNAGPPAKKGFFGHLRSFLATVFR